MARQESGAGAQGLTLKREISLWSAVFLTGVCMIGCVLVHPGSPGAGLVIWAVWGFLAMLGSLCYAELGALIPESGGEHMYTLHTLSSLPAFLDVYTFVLIGRPTTISAISLSFAEYALAPIYPGCSSVPQAVLKTVAATCILLLLLVNCWSSRLATRLTNMCTAAKVVSLLVIVVCVGGVGCRGAGPGPREHWSPICLSNHNPAGGAC